MMEQLLSKDKMLHRSVILFGQGKQMAFAKNCVKGKRVLWGILRDDEINLG